MPRSVGRHDEALAVAGNPAQHLQDDVHRIRRSQTPKVHDTIVVAMGKSDVRIDKGDVARPRDIGVGKTPGMMWATEKLKAMLELDDDSTDDVINEIGSTINVAPTVTIVVLASQRTSGRSVNIER